MLIRFTVSDVRIYLGTLYCSPVRANSSGIFNKNKSGLHVWSKILCIIGPHLFIRVGLVVNDTTIFITTLNNNDNDYNNNNNINIFLGSIHTHTMTTNLFISRIPDNNIFHILYDLYIYYNADYSDIYIYYDEQTKNIDVSNPCQKWRKFLLECVFQCKVKYTNQFCIQSPKRKPFQHTRYIKYDKDPVFVEMLKKHIIPTPEHGKYILLNQRKQNNRYMYDTITGLPIHIFLQQNQDKFPIPFKFCCFDDMTPEEQYHICSESALFISAHGAACSNIIFTPSSTPLIEINFRKDWYCDPV